MAISRIGVGPESLRKLTGVRGSDILFVSDYIAKEH